MLRSSRSSVLVFACLALLVATGTAFGQLAKPAAKPLDMEPGQAVALADGILVDAERQVAYMMAPRRGIDAVDLRGGMTVWTAEVAARPLLVVGDLLIAQGDSKEPGYFNLVSFNVRDGRPGALKARVDLPEGVQARLFDGPRNSFRVRAGLVDNKVVLSWHDLKLGGGELQGYLPAEEETTTPGPGTKSFRQATGTVELDLAAGTVRPFDKAVNAPRSLDVLPRGATKGLSGRVYTSADGRHVLASARNPEGGIWKGYRWTIHSRRGGQHLGSFEHFSSSAPFVVADGRLIFISQSHLRNKGGSIADVPFQLRAVDLASGADLWKTEATDPNFRGPFPP